MLGCDPGQVCCPSTSFRLQSSLTERGHSVHLSPCGRDKAWVYFILHILLRLVHSDLRMVGNYEINCDLLYSIVIESLLCFKNSYIAKYYYYVETIGGNTCFLARSHRRIWERFQECLFGRTKLAPTSEQSLTQHNRIHQWRKCKHNLNTYSVNFVKYPQTWKT